MDEGGSADPFEYLNPTLWAEEAPLPVQVYLSATKQIDPDVALIDPIDWPWVQRHLWGRHSDGRSKLYARRTVFLGGRNLKIWLHREVMIRIGPPPATDHTLVDHKDGNGLNCRRDNLRWATPAMNSDNMHGFYFYQRNWLEEYS